MHTCNFYLIKFGTYICIEIQFDPQSEGKPSVQYSIPLDLGRKLKYTAWNVLYSGTSGYIHNRLYM